MCVCVCVQDQPHTIGIEFGTRVIEVNNKVGFLSISLSRRLLSLKSTLADDRASPSMSSAFAHVKR